MTKETLEEVASRLLYSKYPYHPPKDAGYWQDMFIEGAKWQMERTCNHNYILTSEQSIRIIKCLKCNSVQPI